MEAMYFSLSTMTTIGYGVSDYYFGGCYSPLLIVLLQICTAIVFDAVAVGLIFHRISRGAKRSRSILFSDKAIVQTIRGVPHLMFRLGERRKHHLIEATVRCYCIKHERIPTYPSQQRNNPNHNNNNNNNNNHSNGNSNHNNDDDGDDDVPVSVETTSFVSRQMRLVQPDDRFGSHLWMGLPQVVVHRLDKNSPLLPSSPIWYDVGGLPHRYSYDNDNEPTPPSSSSRLPRGSGDPDSNSNSNFSNSNFSNSNSNFYGPSSHTGRDRAIRDFWYDRDVEVVVLVDGTDEGTGAATQARHSYKLSDVCWDSKFAECVHPYRRRQRSGPPSLDPVVSIDFSRFHDVVPAAPNSASSPYVPEA
mmetsp:Transcript_22625/g.62980  ORF Transcript_22625/g.62980 Transcript_22625/m.62980 type:complete len:360 (-) Transcript_22625:1420-2499(-)